MSEKTILMYTRKNCIYCKHARNLLSKMGVSYTEILIDDNPKLQEEMAVKSSGQKKTPQIWIGDTHIGGYIDLKKYIETKNT